MFDDLDFDEEQFFNISTMEKERSASFGGSTQYSQQFANSNPFRFQCDPSLGTLNSISSSRILNSNPYSQIKEEEEEEERENTLATHQRCTTMMHHHDENEMCGEGTATSSTSSVGHLGADAFVGCMNLTSHEDMMLLDELGPVPRDRCNTWPMRRPQLEPTTQTSPLIHEQIPEEDSDLFGSNEHCGRLGGSTNGSNAILHTPDGHSNEFSPGMSSPGLNTSSISESHRDSPDTANSKKATTRRNAWGNMSYADLISQAIIQSPEQRLTLAQVYEWMVQNVPYFRDKGDSNSSAGWKNSIRHNLSLHSRFMRIQNEGAGKSSWWVINPEAKPGRNPRRARERSNTIDTTTKVAMDKNRRGARKRIKDRSVLLGGMHGSQTSCVSHEMFEDDSMPGSFESMPFRGRTQSNLSVPGSSARVSPTVDHVYDDLDFPSWVDNASSVPQIPSDIVDRTDQMRIDAATHMNGNQSMMKGEQKPLKTDPIAPPSYHELNSVRGPCAQNPLLRNPIVPSTNFKPMPLPTSYSPYNGGWGMHTTTSTTSTTMGVGQSCGIMSHQPSGGGSGGASSALPIDLENLTLPDQPLMDINMDVESLLRHELSQTIDHQLNFDL